MDGSPAKAEDGVVDRRSSGYKSWKKKYRKMRIVFDHKMQHGEELHKQEGKASATIKRLAVENDRLLDLLVEINNSPQIPPEKRIDVSLEPPADPKAVALPMDRQRELEKDQAMKRLEQLLADVPHTSYRASRDSHPAYAADLAAPDGEAHPATFLSADDVDNYIYAVDAALDSDAHISTLAPRAHPAANPVPHPHLKNPTSVTNWLRKHAPKIFLQDGETHGDAGDDGDGHGHGHGAGGHGHGGGRKSRGGRGERGGRGGTRGKRASAAARLAATAAADRTGDWDASMDDDADFASGPAHGRAAKRKRDDDGGYRPGGSTTRPTKKKRKSEGDGPPSARRSKKDKEAAAAAAAAAAKED